LLKIDRAQLTSAPYYMNGPDAVVIGLHRKSVSGQNGLQAAEVRFLLLPHLSPTNYTITPKPLGWMPRLADAIGPHCFESATGVGTQELSPWQKSLRERFAQSLLNLPCHPKALDFVAGLQTFNNPTLPS
jgi:hypothetical protein